MNIFFKILAYAKPYKLLVTIAFITSIFYGLFNAASLWVVGSLIGTIMGMNNPSPESSKIEAISSFQDKIEGAFFSSLSTLDPIEQLKIVCILLFCTFILKNIFFYLNSITLAYIQVNLMKDIRNKLYAKVQNLSIGFFDKNKTGEVLSIMLNDVGMMSLAFQKSFQIFFHDFISMLILTVMLFSINLELSLIAFMTLPLSAAIVLQIGKSIKRKAIRSSLRIADISSIITEKVQGIKIVKAFNTSAREIKLFIQKNELYKQISFKQSKLGSLTTPINDLIGVTMASFLLWYGGQQVLLQNNETPDEFMRFIIFLFALLQPARRLGNAVTTIQVGIAGAMRVFGIMDVDTTKENKISGIKKVTFENSIEFKNINFKYNENTDYILKNINLKINKGEKIALVGQSGSGKTTFSNLLLNFYSPSSGEIFIDNLPYEDLNVPELRSLFGLVTQQPILFGGTISENISYGLPDASSDLIINSAKIANIHEYIDSLENKYDSLIGERGARLSGGQQQRLTIARAILKNPPLLIFDEATSSLDSSSERKVQKAIDNLIKDRTVFIIAHRLSTIINADRIIVFDKGSIIEEGTHNYLMKKKGLYYNFHNIQFQEIHE